MPNQAQDSDTSLAPPETDVSPEFPFELRRASILGLEMAYVDTRPEDVGRSGPTALFLHGNPTSSYIWRNIIPHVSPVMRCVAPDLIGMGESSKPKELTYRFTDHYTFLSAFINRIIPTGQVLLVIQDWGSALGFHWAYQQAEASAPDPPPRVLGMAFMEFLRPYASWSDVSEDESVREVFRAFRHPVQGRQMIIEGNAFVEKMLPRAMVRELAPAEHDYYRRPFLEPASREPTLIWPNQIPIEQFPSDVHDIMTRYFAWLHDCDIPKLLFWCTPGSIVTPEKAEWYQQHMKNADFVHLGQGLHYLQEDHPRAIGQAIFQWLQVVMDRHEVQ